MSGDVPVEFVMLFEETQHPVDAIAKRVRVLAALDEMIAPTEVHAHVAATTYRVPGLGTVVAQDGERLERDAVSVAQPVFVVDGEIAVDAAPDLLALGAHSDGLRYLEHATLEDTDVAVKAQDTFFGPGQRGQHEQ
jgi:hypothetical protein